REARRRHLRKQNSSGLEKEGPRKMRGHRHRNRRIRDRRQGTDGMRSISGACAECANLADTRGLAVSMPFRWPRARGQAMMRGTVTGLEAHVVLQVRGRVKRYHTI